MLSGLSPVQVSFLGHGAKCLSLVKRPVSGPMVCLWRRRVVASGRVWYGLVGPGKLRVGPGKFNGRTW